MKKIICIAIALVTSGILSSYSSKNDVKPAPVNTLIGASSAFKKDIGSAD
jgi:hypothetical protein